MEENNPELGRTDLSQISRAPHAVVANVDHVDDARLLIEDLEDHGIPTTAIELVDAHTKDPRHDHEKSDIAESEALSSLSKSAVIGGLIGVVLGALLGLFMAYLIPGLAWYWGALIGAIFGAGVGGAAGGISIAKYSSPAWDETYQVEDEPSIKVAVHHSDRGVVDSAARVMSPHVQGELERFDNLS